MKRLRNKVENIWTVISNRHCMVIVCENEQEYSMVLNQLSILYDNYMGRSDTK